MKNSSILEEQKNPPTTPRFYDTDVSKLTLFMSSMYQNMILSSII